MAVYRVKGRNQQHIRATMLEEAAVDGRGNAFTLRQMGPPVVFHEGELIDDLTPAELAAFPDRFELVEGEPPRRPPPPGQRLNPEILTLIRRAYAGDSTHAEQEIVGDVLAFVEAYHAGTHTPEQAARLEALLAEFKLPLWGT